MDPFGQCTRVDPPSLLIYPHPSASDQARGAKVARATSLALEATANVFHALSTTTTSTLDIPPHIEDNTFLSCVKRRLSHHHDWHAITSHYTNTQHTLAIVGSHGHLSNRLRLHHQDGVSRGLCAITGCCQDEDSAAGQRDCMQTGTSPYLETANTSF